MSSSLAMAAVSAVLRDMLDNGIVDKSINNSVIDAPVKVSALSPDRVSTNGGVDIPQVNVFLYRVTPNIGWSNEIFPSTDWAGGRVANPPLALDLHYIISVYGVTNLQAEILLGYTMQLLHEAPVLSRDAIKKALENPNFPIELKELSNSGLKDQIEQIKFTPDYLSMEEMSKLWSAFQSHYRPSATYQASVVLIEAEKPVRNALPVLTRGGARNDGREVGVVAQLGLIPPVPTITEIVLPDGQTAIEINKDFVIQGAHLDGQNLKVQLINSRGRIEEPVLLTSVLPNLEHPSSEISVTLTNSNLVAGFYQVSVLVDQQVTGRQGLEERQSNEMPLMIAPSWNTLDIQPTPNEVNVKLNVEPNVKREQISLLMFGQQTVSAKEITGDQTSELEFEFNKLDAGDYLVRLRIDGVDSHFIDRNTSPPQFDANKMVTI